MDDDRTYINTIIYIRDGFERKNVMSESMSESMSELEKTRMQVILNYLNSNTDINSKIAADLLNVNLKTASRLLSKAEKINVLKSDGKTNNKIYTII